MKVIYTEQLKTYKNADLFNQVIEKGKGIYKKVMDAFPGETEPAKKIISDLQEEEMEKRLAEEALQSGTTELTSPEINPEDFTESELRISDAISQKKNVKIGYYTYNTGVYIERNIRPEYIYYAHTTNNNVVVSWCYDWNDYRAFVLENIVFVENINTMEQ